MSNYFLKVNKNLFKMGLNPTEILVLAQITEYQTNNKICYMTDAQFAEDFGVSAKTISRTLDKLEKENLIKRETKTVASKRIRTITAIVKSNGQNDSLNENLKQTICPSETDNLSKSNGQNDFIKDKEKDNLKDNKEEPKTAEEGTIANPIPVVREWLIERHNNLTPLANGLYKYGDKFYKEETK